MDKKQQHKLRAFIKNLDKVRGRHTELVSVYIPAGYDMNKIIGHLEQEKSTAANIKDKTTRKNVIDSLDRLARHLRLYKRTPANGLAAFAGNISETDSKTDIKVFSIEPPEPVSIRLYRCDQIFVLDFLKSLLEYKDVYGLIVMDNREANIGLLKGTMIKDLAHLTSNVPGKTRAGGQSSVRFARLREIAKHEFYKRIAEAVKKEFYNLPDLKGILVGGPSPTKDHFIDGEYLDSQLKKKVMGLKDLSYTGEFGLNELVDKSHDVLEKEAITKEKKLVNELLEKLAREPKKVVYGEAKVKEALKIGAVDILLISEDVEDSLVEELEDLAEEMGSRVEIISTETKEGVQLRDLGKVAAILRYALK